MEHHRTNTVLPSLIAVIGSRGGLSSRVESALEEIECEVRLVQTMRQLRLVDFDREPDLVILEVGELSADRLTAEIDLLRGAGIRAPLFIISDGALPGDRPALISDVVDFATAQATSSEIVARVARALSQTRRPVSPPDRSALPPSRTINGVRIDWRTKEASYGDRTVRFTTPELRMLEAFLDHRGEVLSTGALLRAVWGDDRHRSESLVAVYIWALRGKLSSLDGAFGIETRIGSGYRFTIGATEPKKRKGGGPRTGTTRRLA